MPVDLSIVESTTELGQTVVEVVLDSSSAPGVAGAAGQGVPTGGTAAQVLTKQSATDFDSDWEDVAAVLDVAPPDATYLVTTGHADLDAEVVVGATPGGELGGTWAAPTVDATHSGSSHAATQAAAEATAAAALSSHEGDTTSVHGIADTSVLATDSEVATAVSDHSADTTSVHGIADTSVLATDSEVATAVSDHSADTTAVHGIADTSALALTANHPSNASFDDHSARHEDGGADEISIQGLAGTPVELTNHLSDAADAHDASAVSIADAGGLFTATDVEGALQELGQWATYVPALTAVTTNPTLGVGPTQTGRYVRIGDLVIVHFLVKFGTSGTNAGSGNYRISLPVAGVFTVAPYGVAHLLDNSGGIRRFPDMIWDFPSSTTFSVLMAAAPGGFVTHAAPWAWAASDELSGFLMYEAA